MTNNMVAWNDGLYNRIARYNLTGPTAQRRAFPLIGGNQRCVHTSGAANYLIRGHTGYMGKDGSVYQTFLSRANCSMPNYASYGAVITTTDETCSCYNGIRAKSAFVPSRTFDSDRRC